MKRILIVSIAWLAVIDVGAALAETVVPLNDDQGVTMVMQAGVRERFNDILAQPDSPFEAGLARLALLRSQYQLEQANLMADECIAAQSELNERGLVCSMFKLGNARIAGNLPAFAEQALEIQRKYYSLVREKSKITDATLRGIAGIDMEKLIKLPEMRVESVKDTSVINYQQMPMMSPEIIPPELRSKMKAAPSHTPYIMTKVNGIDVGFLVDTGATITLINPKMATQLGVHPTTALGSSSNGFGISKKVDYAIVDSLTIGGVVLHHWPIGITDIQLPFPVIGLDTLARLGTVRLDKNSLTIYGDKSVKPTCDKPMQLGSELSGYNINISYPLHVSGKLFFAVLDTGSILDKVSGTKILATQSTFDGPKKKTYAMTAYGVVSSNSYVIKSEIQLDKKEESIDVNVDEKQESFFSYVIGSDILVDHALFMDFKKGVLCILDEN